MNHPTDSVSGLENNFKLALQITSLVQTKKRGYHWQPLSKGLGF